jgi:hypothetical protein
VPPSDAGPGEPSARLRLRSRAVLALSALCVLGLLLFCLVRLHVSAMHGTVGIVDDIRAPKESWRVSPAAEVDVLILWRAREAGKYPHYICVRTVLTHTNSLGEYSVDDWWIAPTWPLRQTGLAEVFVFKPGYMAIVDRRLLGHYRSHSHILGPPAMNPWTGVVIPDEDPVKLQEGSSCPEAERL